MKKLLSLIAAAMFAVGGVNAQKEESIWLLSGNPVWGQCTVNRPSAVAENIELHFRSQWSGFPIATNVSTTEYKGVSIEYDCSINTAGVQITVEYEGGAQYNAYIDSNVRDYSITFNEPAVKAGTAKSIAIWQGEGDGKCDIVIKKAYLVKKDGTKQQITTLPSDSPENSAYLSGEFNFKAQWNGATLKDDNSQNITFSSSLNQTHIYTVLLDEAAPIDLTLLPKWKEDADYSHVISAGQNSATFVFTPEYDKEPTNMVFWTGVESGFPAKVKVKSITRGIIYPTSTAVANPNSTTYWGTYSNNLANVELSGANVEVYNLTLGEDNKIVFIKRSDNKVAKGEGVIVKSSGESFNVAVIDETPVAATSNLLKATPTTTQTISSESEKLYCLSFRSGSNDELGFYWGSNNGSSINAVPGKAYLAISNAEAASTKRSIVIDDPETTLVDGIKAEKMQEDAIYNLAGQRIKKLTKGVNVVGNKKVLVK